MEILGIATSLILFFCIVTSVVTGRIRWVLAGLWCVPLIGLGLNYNEGMEINGLVILICIIMTLIFIFAIYGVRLWNIKERKQNNIIYTIVFLVLFTMIFYCYEESRRIGYIPDFLNYTGNMLIVGRGIFLIFVILMTLASTTSVLIFTDRFFSKKMDLVLIQCNFFMGNEANTFGFLSGYYLNGVNNGKMYHLKMTKRSYYMLRKTKRFTFKIRKGCFGGVYILENPCPENIRLVKKRDVKTAIFSSVLSVVFLVGIYFVFYN